MILVIALRQTKRYCTLTTLVLCAVVLLCIIAACTQTSQTSQTLTLVASASSAEPTPSIPTTLESELVSMATKAKKPGDALVRIITAPNSPAIERDLTSIFRGADVLA
ncbi:hypothetical protein OG225_16780 [Nocardia sp. NBC_01377]|uniref:hypothetical protein n=1 Tax=Nocardia sp. NBC_01377 TaxID=2903595 RepID=UPI0032514CED